MSPGYQATIVRAARGLRGEGARLQGQEVGLLVHLVTARRSPRPRWSTTSSTTSPSIDVQVPARRRASERSSEARHPALGGRERLRRHLDDDALDAAREPRPRLPSGGGLRVLPDRRARRTSCSWRRPCAERGRCEAWGLTLEPPLAEAKGAELRGRPLPPSLDRPRLPGRARGLRDPRHRHRRRAHRPRPRLGRLPHGRCATASTSTARWTRAGSSFPRWSTSRASASSTPTPRSWPS